MIICPAQRNPEPVIQVHYGRISHPIQVSWEYSLAPYQRLYKTHDLCKDVNIWRPDVGGHQYPCLRAFGMDIAALLSR